MGIWKGARRCWVKTIDDLKDEANTISSSASSEQIHRLGFFVASVVNLLQSCFSSETGEFANSALLSDENLLNSLVSVDRIQKQHPQVLADISNVILLHSMLGKIYSSKGNWTDAYGHYKYALSTMESHFKRSLNLSNKLVLFKQFEYLYSEFVECCSHIATSDQRYISEMYWGIANSRQRQFLSIISFLPLDIPNKVKESIPSELIKRESTLLRSVKDTLFKDPGSLSEEDYFFSKKSIEELERIWDELGTQYPDYVSLRLATPLKMKEVFDLL